jgi:hypothetical protein
VSATFDRVRALAQQRKVLVSQHGFVRLTARGILITEVVRGVIDGEPIEDYPDYPAGPAVLVLQRDGSNQPLHVVWGIEKNMSEPAVVVTAYRPRPEEWNEDFRRRRS